MGLDILGCAMRVHYHADPREIPAKTAGTWICACAVCAVCALSERRGGEARLHGIREG